MSARRALVLVVAALAGACDDAAPDVPGACSVEERQRRPLAGPRAVDLLIVLDRTASMADQDARLPEQAQALINVLNTIPGGLPDMHLAVVTTDLGAAGVPGCTDGGDRAVLVDGERCGIAGRFLSDAPAADGARVRNHQGTTADAFVCLLDLPRSTCPVSQPLAAIVRALDGSVPANTGFRRHHAELAVVVVTDGDDCSLVDPAALAEAAGATDVEAAVDFACFARGAACAPVDPATLGPHRDCLPRADLGLIDVDATMRHLTRTLAPDPRLIIFSTLTGGADVFVGPGPRLMPTCLDGGAGPAARLRAALIPNQTTHGSLCDRDWSDVLVLFAELLGGVYDPCFDPAIDLQPLVPGLQPECTAELTHVDGMVEILSPCTDPDREPGRPCLRPTDDSPACPGRTAIEVDLDGALLARGAWVDIRCARACP